MQDRLLRSRTDRVIGGVCGGLAHYFDLDPVIVRLIFVLMLMGGGIGVLLYIVLWAVIPSEKAQQHRQVGGRPAPPGALPHEMPDQSLHAMPGRAPYDPGLFRYDPYTGQPIQPTAHPRVGDIAQPERVAATGRTIDLRRESIEQVGVAEDHASVPPPAAQGVVPPVPPYSRPAPHSVPRQRIDRRSQLGVILLIIGALIFASEFGIGQFFFPALLIIGGFLLLIGR